MTEYIKANCNNAIAACDFEDELSGGFGNHMNNNNDDRDLALCIACKKFDEKYPKEMQPEWLKYCMFMKAARNQNKNWVIQMALSPKPKTKPNQYWHWEDDGIPVLIDVDLNTQKETIVLCDGPAPDLEVFFEVEVDLAGDRVTVRKDTDPNKLDGTKYEMNIRF